MWLGTVRLLRGDPAGAPSTPSCALAAARERQDPLAIYIGLFTGAQIALAVGDHDRARRQLDEGILLSVDTGDMANLAYFLDAVGVVEAERGAGRAGSPSSTEPPGGCGRRSAPTSTATTSRTRRCWQQAIDAAREALGDDFAAAVAAGRRLDVPEVVSLATTSA